MQKETPSLKGTAAQDFLGLGFPFLYIFLGYSI
jgi:hypothetical protein